MEATAGAAPPMLVIYLSYSQRLRAGLKSGAPTALGKKPTTPLSQIQGRLKRGGLLVGFVDLNVMVIEQISGGVVELCNG